MEHKIRQKPAEKVWSDFQAQEQITDEQLAQFKQYEALLTEWNKVMNLTAIRGISEIVSRHFVDSLALRKFIDLSKVRMLVDIGSGAGFPGIPLKIMFPHVDMILIEVRNKRQRFLKTVIQTLGLKNIEVCALDWRTFLRTTECNVEESMYFITRASVETAELCRMFKPGCSYKNEQLIYWAAGDWEPDELTQKFILREFEYSLKRKKRKLVLMGLKK